VFIEPAPRTDAPPVYINAFTFHRIARTLLDAKVPLLPRIFEGMTYLIFNCSVPVTATIGAGSRCEHRGVGVVIHPHARIGERCRIHAHVVVGGAAGGTVGVPVIGDNVIIGAGAKVLGPISIGNDVTIGANAVVLADVPAGSTAVGVPARLVSRDRNEGVSSDV
jgi:serine O-acetyltransferase